jgi:hypothetical protein
MKKLFYMLAVAGVMTLAGCSKEHQCKCVTTDVQDDGLLKYFVVEGSIACEDITEMAFEEHVSVEGGTSLQRVEVHKVSCRSYGD